TYRNILRLQQDELKARETSLRSRIDAFRRELESREKAFGQLKERESDVVRREDEFRRVMNRVHERQRELEKREELLREKARLLDERHHALTEGEVDQLLGDLPADKIEGFAKSKKFALYEKILDSLEL